VREGTFHPIPAAPAEGAIERLLARAYRAAPFRVAVLALPTASRFRHSLVTQLFAWVYRNFNETGQIPRDIFAEDIRLHQSAALIDTAGTFLGLDGLERALSELRDALEEIRFEPLSVAELAADRFLVLVRFRASGRGSGVEVDQHVGHLFSLRQGSVVRWEVYWDEEDALAAAGLKPEQRTTTA
jgi:ketosteroid isomerase-like protein